MPDLIAEPRSRLGLKMGNTEAEASEKVEKLLAPITGGDYGRSFRSAFLPAEKDSPPRAP